MESNRAAVLADSGVLSPVEAGLPEGGNATSPFNSGEPEQGSAIGKQDPN
jgi:hypothetical protein